MSRSQIMRCIGSALLVAGVLIFIDATLNEYIWNTVSVFGLERFGPALYAERADAFNQQQIFAQILAAMGGGLVLVPSSGLKQGEQ